MQTLKEPLKTKAGDNKIPCVRTGRYTVHLSNLIFTGITTSSGGIIHVSYKLASSILVECNEFVQIFPCQVGFSHSNILRTIIQHACLRFPALLSHNIISSPSRRRSKSASVTEAFIKQHKKVYVIFGGDTSERQVSLMSGTNVWLNLRASDDVSFRVYQTNESSILNIILQLGD